MKGYKMETDNVGAAKATEKLRKGAPVIVPVLPITEGLVSAVIFDKGHAIWVFPRPFRNAVYEEAVRAGAEILETTEQRRTSHVVRTV